MSSYKDIRADGVDRSIGKYLSDPIIQGKAPAMWAAIINENGIEAVAAAGVRKRGSPEKATVEDQIHVGSLTKAMTSVLLARLVANGALANGWNTTLVQVFPELDRKIHASYHEVPLNEFVRHRSGLARNAANWWAYRDRDIKKRRYRLLKTNLRSRPAKPRGGFWYSNLGYMVAGAMAERVTGKSWEELMGEHVFGPLGMKRTGFGVPGTTGEVDEPWGHRRSGPGKWKGVQDDNDASFGPAGTVHMTLGDYANFARLWFQSVKPQILTRKQRDELAIPHKGKYAAGWYSVPRDWGDGNVLTHTGSNTYWRARVSLAPNTGKAYIAAANASNDEIRRTLDAIICKLINHEP